VLGFNFINYFARNLDKVIIGKLLGPAALGFYDISYQIMLKPLQNISQTISAPLFPALSSIQDDKVQAAEVYRRVVVYIALITFPVMTGIALVAADFVPLLLGEQWSPAVPVLQILCVVGAIQSVGSTVGDVYLSQGRSDIMLKWVLAASPFFATAFYIGATWGLIWVAACYAAVSVPLSVASHEIANRLIGLDRRRFWLSFLPLILMCAIMAMVVIGTQAICRYAELQQPLSLLVSILTGMSAYGSLLYFSSNPDIVAVRTRLLKTWN